MEVIYVSNDNLLIVDALYDNVAAAYINNATVTVTLKTEAGVTVTGQSFPATLSYVAASNGKYRCVLEDALVITAGTVYIAHITANGGADKVAAWQVPIRAITRTE